MTREIVERTGGVVSGIEHIGIASFVKLSPVPGEKWTEKEILLALHVDADVYTDQLVDITRTTTGRLFKTVTHRIETADVVDELVLSGDMWSRTLNCARAYRSVTKPRS